MDIINYKLDKFEGPLDLLLHLIEKNKIDIYDIPIAMITEQYLNYVASMSFNDLDLMSNFLVMATTLLEIKSKMLLPLIKNNNEEEIDPREELVNRLLEYKKYKDLGKMLLILDKNAPIYFFKPKTIPKTVANYIPKIDYEELLKGIDIYKLKELVLDVIRRKDNSIDQIRSNFGTIKKEKLPLKDALYNLLNESRNFRTSKFSTLFTNKNTKSEIIVTFLALLELIKMGRLMVVNSNINDFEIINIETEKDEKISLDLTNVEDE